MLLHSMQSTGEPLCHDRKAQMNPFPARRSGAPVSDMSQFTPLGTSKVRVLSGFKYNPFMKRLRLTFSQTGKQQLLFLVYRSQIGQQRVK